MVRTFVQRHSPEQKSALEIVEGARKVLVEAQKEYDSALVLAHQLGLSNAAIAMRIGQSETAVRTYLRRRGYPKEKH